MLQEPATFAVLNRILWSVRFKYPSSPKLCLVRDKLTRAFSGPLATKALQQSSQSSLGQFTLTAWASITALNPRPGWSALIYQPLIVWLVCLMLSVTFSAPFFYRGGYLQTCSCMCTCECAYMRTQCLWLLHGTHSKFINFSQWLNSLAN